MQLRIAMMAAGFLNGCGYDVMRGMKNYHSYKLNCKCLYRRGVYMMQDLSLLARFICFYAIVMALPLLIILSPFLLTFSCYVLPLPNLASVTPSPQWLRRYKQHSHIFGF